MNDEQRAALVDELAEAMYEAAPVVLSGHGVGDSIVIPWDSGELDESYRFLARGNATACLPIIDRLLTAHSAELWRRADGIMAEAATTPVSPETVDKAHRIVRAYLTALLGPRPEGEPDER